MQSIADKVKVTLVDDCSPDGGYEDIARQFAGELTIDCVTLSENGGPGVARQAGMDETDGDFICFMDADDTLCSAFALQQMARTMIEDNMDVVSGQFIEEMENGTFFVHPRNMIWVFGKLYRRSFIDRFLIRFNETRCNEDTGFNTLVNALTSRVAHIPQTVYMWHFAENTITRNNKGEYTFAHGHRGYIENMIWAAKEMERRSINKEIYRSHVVRVLCRLFFMHEHVMAAAPREAVGSWDYIVKFFKECFLPIEDYVPAPYLTEVYMEEHNNTKVEYMPRGNFRTFLRDLRDATAEKPKKKKAKDVA
jgi:glycosyltransferase involved in cell wall biosynthesis